jgi:hypothetical protein
LAPNLWYLWGFIRKSINYTIYYLDFCIPTTSVNLTLTFCWNLLLFDCFINYNPPFPPIPAFPIPKKELTNKYNMSIDMPNLKDPKVSLNDFWEVVTKIGIWGFRTFKSYTFILTRFSN